MGFLVKYNPAPLLGAKKMSSLLVWQPAFFFFFFFLNVLLLNLCSLCHSFATFNCPGASQKLLSISPSAFLHLLPRCSKLSSVNMSSSANFRIVHFRRRPTLRVVLISPLRFVLGLKAWMCQTSSEECGYLLSCVIYNWFTDVRFLFSLLRLHRYCLFPVL